MNNTHTRKIRIGFIGYGIQARTSLLPQFCMFKDRIDIVALCDCDRVRRTAGVKHVDREFGRGTCRAVADFRDILRDPAIDAVVIATPDHWHAYMSVEAMKHGKDVYCEKPLTYCVEESKTVIAAQKKYKRVFQGGSMQRSWPEFRTAAQLVRNGCIGRVRFVDCQYGRNDDKDILGGTSQPHRFYSDPAKAATEGAPNPDCDWNMWLGPAPWSPYSDQCAPRGNHDFYPMFWRFDDHYGTGYNGDWGAHHLDIAQWGLGMDKSGPVRILASTEPHSSNPFHGGRRQYGMKFVFEDGCVLEHRPFGVWGTVFYGTSGVVAVNRGKIAVWRGRSPRPTEEVRAALAEGKNVGSLKLLAASIGRDYGTDCLQKKDDSLAATIATLRETFDLDHAKKQLYRPVGHIENFLDCIRTRKATLVPSETGARAAILTQLCNLAYVYDTGFDWDPKKNAFANGTGDAAWLTRPAYRNGWTIKV